MDAGASTATSTPVRGLPSATRAKSAKMAVAVLTPLVVTTNARGPDPETPSAAAEAMAAETPGMYPTTAPAPVPRSARAPTSRWENASVASPFRRNAAATETLDQDRRAEQAREQRREHPADGERRLRREVERDETQRPLATSVSAAPTLPLGCVQSPPATAQRVRAGATGVLGRSDRPAASRS